MIDLRQRRLDVAAGGLLLAGLLVAVAVFSHDPADLPGAVYPPNAEPHNLLGVPGAALAAALIDALGAAVHVLLITWLVLVLLLFQRRHWPAWSARLLGWLILVPCAAVLGDAAGRCWPEAAPAGAGGSVGAWLGLWLIDHLGLLPRVLLVGGVCLLGALLGLDFALLRLAQGCRRLAAAGGRRLFFRRAAAAPAGPAAVPIKRPRSDRTPPEGTAGDGLAAPAPADGIQAAPPDPEMRTIPIHHHSDLAGALGSLTLDLPPLPAPLTEEERFADYELPPLSLLEDPQPFDQGAQDQELRDRAALLEKTFADFGLNVRVVGINTGPVVTQFEVALETGLRVQKVLRLADDIALNLRAASIRMAAVPGRSTLGIEVPNELRADVRLKEVMLASAKKIARSKLPLFIGKDAEGRPLVHDLADMPHLLIAGSTGTGKSVCLNSILLSILMTRRPDEVKLILIDPKVVELGQFGRVPHLIHPVVSDMKKAEAILAWAVDKMEERYDLLRRARVRSIAGYNELPAGEAVRRAEPADEEERRGIPERLPYIVLVIDEVGDLILQMKKEVEGHIIRLAQKSRAAGIHLVLATQKPTVDVITGLIKSNLPARICFKVVNKSDSRVVLDEMGADKLLGRGDLLFLPPGTSTLVRGQGTFASEAEIQAVVGQMECDPCFAAELMQLELKREDGGSLPERLKKRDELYAEAVEVVVREGRGSTSLLQRALGIGYGRASRLIDFMAEDGIVGGYNGSSAREVLYTPEQWAAVRNGPEP
jgi:S-DNA-T family DNA segregation ATPase FtsK/SpoIIIE